MAIDPDQSVIVVGAGPTGLTLACELAAAGVSCTLLERRTAPSSQSRAMGLYSRTMEVLDLRGHADELAAHGRPVSRMFLAGNAMVDFGRLDSRFPYLNSLPQSRTEAVLQQRALDLGVIIQREAEVHALEQDAGGVTLQVRSPEGEWEESADYVVGCDGAHSVVRGLAGIAFRGRTYPIAPILADVRLRKPPKDDLLLITGPGGILVSSPYGDGVYRLAVARSDRPWTRDEVTLDELRGLLTEALGFDPEPYDALWLARFRIHQRIADQYRSGRVLIAGDAAHLHSPLGGQGLNLGIQDAVNLGWKLAAEVQGWAPPGLLDTYESERRPRAQQILRATDRATRAATSSSPLVQSARRAVLRTLLSVPGGHALAGNAITGLSTGYTEDGLGSAVRRRLSRVGLRSGPAGIPVPTLRGGDQVRTGQRLPDLTVPRPDGTPVRLYELMRDGRFLLLDLTEDGAPAKAAESWGARVSPVALFGPLPRLDGAAAVLVRPDGYAAWVDPVGDAGDRAERVRGALRHWCGAEAAGQDTESVVTGRDAALAGREKAAEAEAADDGAESPATRPGT